MKSSVEYVYKVRSGKEDAVNNIDSLKNIMKLKKLLACMMASAMVAVCMVPGNVSFAAEAGTMTAAKAETKTGIGAGTLEHVAGVFEGQEINSEYSFLNSADNTDEMLARPRMEYRFYIPDVGINVALFNVTGMTYAEKQPYGDAEDSGTWQQSKNMVVLGDHAYEGFIVLKDVVVGETLCYVQRGTDVIPYLCAAKGMGINTTKALLDENGNSLTALTGYSLLSYCCADSYGENIHYALWVPAE